MPACKAAGGSAIPYQPPFAGLGRAAGLHDRGLAWMLALAVFLAALAWRLEMTAWPDAPFVTFLPAVAAAAWVGGWMPATAVALASLLAAWSLLLHVAGGASWPAGTTEAMLIFSGAAALVIAPAAFGAGWRTEAGPLPPERLQRALQAGCDRALEHAAEWRCVVEVSAQVPPLALERAARLLLLAAELVARAVSQSGDPGVIRLRLQPEPEPVDALALLIEAPSGVVQVVFPAGMPAAPPPVRAAD